MIIQVSINFLRVTKNFRKKDWNETIDDKNIFDKISEALVYDNILAQSEITGVEWVVIKNQFQGIYIPEFNKVIHFCQMMTAGAKARSRNTFLKQNIKFTDKFARTHNATVSISINPYDLGRPTPTANFITTSLREAASLGFGINRSINFRDDIFDSLIEYVNVRQQLRSHNTGNNSTIMQINYHDRIVTVYGRLDGANGSDTLSSCRLLARLALRENYRIEFFDVTPVEARISPSLIQEIDNMQYDIQDVVRNEQLTAEALFTREIHEADFEDLLKRDQSTFKANIIKKYISVTNFNIHTCFACNYIVEENFIGSHIYRYADIKNDFNEGKLTNIQAAHLIVSGDNGFLFCPNQDKEFEKGMIYFDLKRKIFVANEKRLSDDCFKQVSNNIQSQNFSSVIFSDEFISNNEEHHKRIKL